MWEQKLLREVAVIFAGGDVDKSRLSKERTERYPVPIFTNGEKNSGLYGFTCTARVLKPSVTVSARGTIGYSAIRNEPFYPAVRLIVVTPKSDLINLSYLKYSIDRMEISHSGVSIPQLTVPMIKEYPITLPPLEEQKRIVGILDEAFAGIDQAIANTEKNITNAKELVEGRLAADIFSNSTTESLQETTVAEVALSEKGSMRTGPFGSQLLKREFVDDGIAVLGIDNAVENEFRWGKRRFITHEKFKELSRFQVKPGDVLITIMGTCGRCVIVPDDIPLAINTKHICCISLDTSKCLPAFLHAYFLHNPVAQQYLLSRAKGAIMAGLNMGIIKELPLFLPSISEQEIIIEKIEKLRSEVKRLKATYKQKLVDLKELKQSLLQMAFAGELTSDMRQVA